MGQQRLLSLQECYDLMVSDVPVGGWKVHLHETPSLFPDRVSENGCCCSTQTYFP